MRSFIYKVLVSAVAFIVVFEFTIGKRINDINKKINIISTKDGRKELVNSIKNEMAKAIQQENYLEKDEAVLISKFINKIKKELNENN